MLQSQKWAIFWEIQRKLVARKVDPGHEKFSVWHHIVRQAFWNTFERQEAYRTSYKTIYKHKSYRLAPLNVLGIFISKTMLQSQKMGDFFGKFKEN